MNRLRTTTACAAACAAALLFSTSHVTGQSPAAPESGRSFSVYAAGSSLPVGLARMDAMLSDGSLDIASTQQDTMIPGRVHERLQQVYKGLPVFDAQLVRQMDGRSIISLSGRLYDSITIETTPQISSERAADIAVAAAGE